MTIVLYYSMITTQGLTTLSVMWLGLARALHRRSIITTAHAFCINARRARATAFPYKESRGVKEDLVKHAFALKQFELIFRTFLIRRYSHCTGGVNALPFSNVHKFDEKKRVLRAARSSCDGRP